MGIICPTPVGKGITDLPKIGNANGAHGKVEKISEDSLTSTSSSSLWLKIQIMDGKVCLRCEGKTLLGVVNKILRTDSLLTCPRNVLLYCLKQTLLPIIWIFTQGEEDEIESELSS